MHGDGGSGGAGEGAAASAPPNGQGTYSFVGLLTLLVRERRLLLGLPLAAAVAAVLAGFLLPRTYSAESRFMPETESRLPAEMAGLAAQFGISPPGETESLDFYVELLRTNDFLREVVLTSYRFPVEEGQDTLSGTLLDLWRIEGEDPTERVQQGITELRDERMVAYVRRSAGVIYLQTEAAWPALAELLNQRMLDLVNQFNLDRRRTHATAQREFLEVQVTEAENDLRGAENELESFIAANRRYADAPETRFEYQRLQRRVTFLERIHTARAEALEQARLEAVRNMPVITIVDGPAGTAIEDRINPYGTALLAALLAFALAVAYLLVKRLLRDARRSRPAEYLELMDATRHTVRGLRAQAFLRRGRSPAPREAATGDAGRESPSDG